MKVYKFGGASVKDAEGIRNIAHIVSHEKGNLVIVISAFGKTTNALEKVLKAFVEGDREKMVMLEEIFKYHKSIIENLFTGETGALTKIETIFSGLKEFLADEKRAGYDFEYDQVVSFGEIWSTIIVAEYLKTCLSDVEWIDIRENLITDDRYRDANILWNESNRRIQDSFDFKKKRIYVTQGFIGGTASGNSTTLGREGSDYTAAIIANILDAECVMVLKDVPGILNADPKWLADTEKIDEMSYREAVEMTFSGAKVIHPKTIKPLHNKNIPLHVKSFINPFEPGTVIKADAVISKVVPVFIKKEDQILISIVPRDFSFVMGDNLSRIFHSFMLLGITVNLVEASAVSLDVCVNDEKPRVEGLLEEMRSEFAIVYNDNVEMLTIRHYTKEAIDRITKGREVLLEQRTRSMVRYVVRKE